MASAGETCTQCWVGALQLHEGMLVCDVCGSIHQGFAEETQEYQTGISDARFFKKSEGMQRASRAAAAEEEKGPPPVGEAVKAYVQAIQALLQHQAQALIERFGMDPGLSPVLRELWLAFVAHSRLLEPASISRLETLAEQAPGSASDADDAPSEEEGVPRSATGRVVLGQMTHNRRSMRLQHEIGPILRLQHTLLLVLLACWRQQEAASPLDITRWALDGHLPYLSFAAAEGAGLTQYRNTLGPDLLVAKGVPTPYYLHTQAAELAAKLGLDCPPISPALWLERYVAQLELPQALLPVALQLSSLYQPPLLLLPTQVLRPARHPWAHLMAALVVAAKLCYGLDGRNHSVPSAPPPPAWHDWAQRQARTLASVSAYPLSIQEAAQLDDGGLRAYLQYLQSGLFASFAPPPELESGKAIRRQLFHADYVALLVACSPMVWLLPESLHEVVSALEQQMIGAECEVAYRYNAQEQARLARLEVEAAWQKLWQEEQRQEQLAKEAAERAAEQEAASMDTRPPAATTSRPPSPLKAGNVRCPVCNRQLPNDDAAVNSHIDKCLSKGALQKRTQQASIFRFAAPVRPSPSTQQPSAQQHQQQQQQASNTARRRSGGGDSLAASAAAAASQILGAAGSRPEEIDLTDDCPLPLAVELEPDNCLQSSRCSLFANYMSRLAVGHLPHVVTRHLAPLMRASQVTAEAVVLEEPLGEKEPLLVALQPAAPGASPRAAGRLNAALGRAQDAAAAHVQAGPQATGERLHANFLAVLQTVQQHDSHLLDELETSFIAAYKALPLPAQCLYLRLFQRKGSLFRIASLAYKEVPDAAAAAKQLAEAGLAAVLAHEQCGNMGSPVAGGPGQQAGSSSGSGADSGIAAIAATDWRQLADLLTVPELAALLAARRFQLSNTAVAGVFRGGGNGAGGMPARNRQQLIEALERGAAPAQLATWLLQAAGPVLQLAEQACEAVERLQRLFFLNEGQSLSQFLASDMGALQYPQYQVHRSHQAFASRQELLDYEAALRHAGQLTDALEANGVAAAEQALQPAWAALDASLHKQERDGTPAFLRQFDAGFVYCSMATAGVSLLERQKRYQEAIDRLHQLLGGACCLSRRGDWWTRLATNLVHLKRKNEALEQARMKHSPVDCAVQHATIVGSCLPRLWKTYCLSSVLLLFTLLLVLPYQVEAALADEWLSRGDRLGLQRRWLRLAKEPANAGGAPRRWVVPPWAKAAGWEPPEVRIVGTKSRFYGFDDAQCTVEELALQYYATEDGGGWQGVHSEGGIWATLWGLLLWEVLFMPVPDVFRTRFQTAPLDLDTPLFYPARKDAIEECLARIAAGQAPAMLRSAWAQHRGTMCRGVNWDRHSLEDLQLVAECIGGPGLAQVCRLLAQDHGGWSGGMPDLLLWHAGRRAAKLSEVKGPRDRLSDQQRAWMVALSEAGLRAEVLKVVEPEASGGKSGGGKKRKKR
ncbi:hypothetical protein COHA_006524 [Chlorella ohadii]|uniref:Fanconi-associated nuclease n=1 Tax=Chlorella ohadii TaxID=2649997 RepID=A0AAD5H4A6_9CHLO|nr:hypothetical protein COHA_006524 [Chlorella ohadii]